MRETHQGDPSGIDPGMRDENAQRAVGVRDPLRACQRPRTGADLGQATSGEAVEEKGCVPPLLEGPCPPQFGVPDSTAAMSEDNSREGSGPGGN